jgi:hypothetical protein
MMLQHNTPGKSDGEQAFWINGQLRGHWRGINWRTNPDLYADAFGWAVNELDNRSTPLILTLSHS